MEINKYCCTNKSCQNYFYDIRAFYLAQTLKHNTNTLFMQFEATVEVIKSIKQNFYLNNELQWTPLNGITLGQIQTDNINQMITINE